MRRPSDFVYQAAALVISALLVHAVYVTVVWPRSEAALAEQSARMREDPGFVQERSVWVLLRDYEQESEIILMLWALAIIVQKRLQTRAERRLLERDLLPLAEGMTILPEDVREWARQVEALPVEDRETLLPQAVLAALHRFGATRSIADASARARELCESAAERFDSEMSLLRYIAWAIPAIGFIGTVRGIGDAMGQAHRAMQGDLGGVTQSLGTAFNSTLIALLLSLVLMFLLHHLQEDQERLVRDSETYLDRRVVQRLRVA
ncbi:MAG: MotA/TolQ/ExbB proton channel family protein [Vicinamibacteria bacterium]|nr:MotA/TolQ/ExbB proton channel family protein [Vicinamibacteria bacterium]